MSFQFIGKILNKILPNQNEIQIYTDGSHKEKWGSWAFVVVKNHKVLHESSGSTRKTNSLRMEFQAVVEALSYLKPRSKAVLHSDSKIIIDCFNSPYLRPNSNLDQLEQIDELLVTRKVKWKWVKGHSGIVFNERCDQLCVLARDANR